MSVPRVSVLMAVHNGEATLRAAVESMLGQTFEDFELVVVNDGSSDGTRAVLQGIDDKRLRVLENGRNLGLSASLNVGWASCRGTFVARMDADDLSMPGRIALQVALMERHPEIAVAGGSVETFSGSGAGATIKYPAVPGAVSATLLFRSALAHPAVMIRKEAIDRAGLRYEEQFRYAQDYALWLACVAKGLVLTNSAEVVLRYRVHAGQLSHSMERMQGEGTVIRSRFLATWLGSGLGEGELALHDEIARDRLVANEQWIEAAASWLERLGRFNEVNPLFEQEAFVRVLTGRYVSLLRFADNLGLRRPPAGHSLFGTYIHADALTAR